LLAKAEGVFTEAEWRAKCAEYGNKCGCCRQSKPLHADHIIPLSKGGSNVIANIQPLCKSCNSRKGTKAITFPTADASNAIIRIA
jgi:5-methylcytosine-specific restriction endonuclease McrA